MSIGHPVDEEAGNGMRCVILIPITYVVPRLMRRSYFMSITDRSMIIPVMFGEFFCVDVKFGWNLAGYLTT